MTEPDCIARQLKKQLTPVRLHLQQTFPYRTGTVVKFEHARSDCASSLQSGVPGPAKPSLDQRTKPRQALLSSEGRTNYMVRGNFACVFQQFNL